MRYTPSQTPERTPADDPPADFVAMFGKLELIENQSAEGELQEKLGRFYVETGPFNIDTNNALKAGGFRWEPIVKHWWAPEIMLCHKTMFIGRWPQYNLTDQDKESLRNSVVEGLSKGGGAFVDSRSYPATPLMPHQEQGRRNEARRRASPSSATSQGLSTKKSSKLFSKAIERSQAILCTL
ncbi:hypothetical protein V491_03399 [Pseudogymnoascus sp. VKM F-3775]|nr:hypothetical protein V491_03399 [Pseudogymnoascus sp. VKM F-3775]